MKAVRIVGPRRLEAGNYDVPVPQEGQVLVKAQRLSICGSDMRNYRHVVPEEEYPLLVGFPCHECAGVVEESLSQEFNRGDRVIVLPSNSDGLAEYLVEPSKRLIKLPPQGDLSVQLMCQPFGTVLYSCKKMGSVLGKRVVVLGQGAIGLSFTILLSRQYAAEVIAVDPLDYRLDLSQKLGATRTLNPLRDNVLQVVEEMTKGELADVVVEATGTEEAVNQAFHLARQEGMVVHFGLPPEDTFNMEFMKFSRKMVTLLPTHSARSADPAQAIREAVALMNQGRVDLSSLVTHRTTFDNVQWAYDTYEGHLDNSVKIVMEV